MSVGTHLYISLVNNHDPVCILYKLKNLPQFATIKSFAAAIYLRIVKAALRSYCNKT